MFKDELFWRIRKARLGIKVFTLGTAKDEATGLTGGGGGEGAPSWT